MEAVDGLRVSCFLSGHVMWLPGKISSSEHRSRPASTKNLLAPLLSLSSFFFSLHLPHITFKMAFGKLYGLPVCFSSSLYFDSMSDIL